MHFLKIFVVLEDDAYSVSFSYLKCQESLTVQFEKDIKHLESLPCMQDYLILVDIYDIDLNIYWILGSSLSSAAGP